jgi:recombination protein RecR
VVEHLTALPGVGPKSALRMGMALLQWPEARVRSFGQSLIDLRQQLCLCSLCGSLADADPCPVCTDPTRQDDLLCLVADWDSMVTIDEAGLFRGRYLVLGGLLSPLDNVQAKDLALERLRDRLEAGGVRELILALGTTRESETTESYICGLVRDLAPGVRVSRLAQGIPIGSEMRYVDRETLKQSLTYRQSLG